MVTKYLDTKPIIVMKKFFAFAIMFAAVAMVSCCNQQKKAECCEENCTECTEACCAEKAECAEACCAEKAECTEACCEEKAECAEGCEEKK